MSGTSADSAGTISFEQPSKYSVLSAVALATFFVSLSTNTLSVAVPVIVRHFGASAVYAALIVLTPSLTSTGLLLSMGRVGDLVDRRICYLAGISCFTAASVAAGLAPSAWALIVLEACAAVGTAAIWANSAAIIVDTVPAERVNRALGVYIAAISVAELIGPSVGGAVAGSVGWRWIYWMNVPVGVGCLLWGRAAIRPVPPTQTGRLDMLGSGLLFVGLAGLVLSLSLAQTFGWLKAPVAAGTVGALAVLALFVAVETWVSSPLFDLALLRDRRLLLALVAGFANAMALWSLVLLMVLYFQALQGDSPLMAGLKSTPLPVCTAIAAVCAGQLARRLTPATLACIGPALSCMGLVFLAVTLGGQYLATFAALALVGLGGGIFMPANANIVMTSARASAGLLNGTRLMLQQVGWVTGTAISLTIVTAPLVVSLRRQFFAGTTWQISPGALAALHSGYLHALTVLAAVALLSSATSFLSRASRSTDGLQAGRSTRE
jgi:MFS family permease